MITADTQTAPPLMRIDTLSVHTPDGVALVEPISFDLHANRALIILGETGSGKSLLVQAIMGALPDGLHTKGKIDYQGEPLTPQSTAKLWGRKLAMLAQEPTLSLDPTMTVFGQVYEGFYYIAKQPKSAAQDSTQSKLSQLGLKDFGTHYPHQLSGGMAQRSAFATVSTGGADIIIADEPTKGLDSKNRQIVVDLLKQIIADGGTLLIITHDIEVASSLAATPNAALMVMKKGQLLEQGLASEILAHPTADYTKQMLKAAPSHWQALGKTKPVHCYHNAQNDIKNTQTSTPKTPLLTAENLGISRGKTTLFSGLNFTLHLQDIIGITGASGIGKSSLGDVLCGLLPPSTGRLHWHQTLKRHQLLKLYQDPSSAFATHISLQTLLDDVVKRHRLNTDKIPKLLDALRLEPELLHRSASHVSGGELQRFAILRALLLEPVVLFADEATSRLDPITQEITMDLLVEQCQTNRCALVIVSHDLDLVRHYSRQTIDLTDYLPQSAHA
ncbi:ABC transporter ATP-binding protein [Moraxella marmotae]|uniref:ABC transporter ATP-binding protein n=1 Tax=Moraxella marmotae TaxID=3344520 RepID=UPI0035F3620E